MKPQDEGGIGCAVAMFFFILMMQSCSLAEIAKSTQGMRDELRTINSTIKYGKL